MFLAATASNTWGKAKNADVGLWKYEPSSGSSITFENSDLIDCAKGDIAYIIPEDTCKNMLAARAFNVMAVILSGLAMIFAALIATGKESLAAVNKGLVPAAFVTGLIGFAIGTNLYTNVKPFDTGYDAGASVGVSVVAWVFALGASVLSFMGGAAA